MLVARFVRFLTRFRHIQPQVGRLQAAILRRSRGRIRRSRLLAGGQPVLALTTTGRRSGKPRSTTVAYLRHGQAYAVGALNLGSDHDPGWALNLRANPDAFVTVNGQRRVVRARQASGEEARGLWQALIRRLPAIENSLRLSRRDVPLFVLEPA